MAESTYPKGNPESPEIRPLNDPRRIFQGFGLYLLLLENIVGTYITIPWIPVVGEDSQSHKNQGEQRKQFPALNWLFFFGGDFYNGI